MADEINQSDRKIKDGTEYTSLVLPSNTQMF